MKVISKVISIEYIAEEVVIKTDSGIIINVPEGHIVRFMDDGSIVSDKSNEDRPTNIDKDNIQKAYEKLCIERARLALNDAEEEDRNGLVWTEYEENYVLWLHATGSELNKISRIVNRGVYGIRDRLYGMWDEVELEDERDTRSRSIKTLLARANR